MVLPLFFFSFFLGIYNEQMNGTRSKGINAMALENVKLKKYSTKG